MMSIKTVNALSHYADWTLFATSSFRCTRMAMAIMISIGAISTTPDTGIV
ncbi:MAG: hypothetical protein ACFHHU_03290 [Porticoccaceae bacterium]